MPIATSQYPASFDLKNLNGFNGFTLNGINRGDAGWSVSTAGDINGDGLTDLLIGAFEASPNGNLDVGQTYVVFGNTQPWPASLDLSILNGTNGFTLNGINAYDHSGVPVATAGDINGDGLSDLLIGANQASPNGNYQAGQTYVVFGRVQPWPVSLSLSILNGTNGFILNGINPNDQSGWSVSTAGDINGDGIADVIIGAPGFNNGTGQSAVVFGRAQSWPASLSLSTLNGTNGFILNGINPNDQSGWSVSTAGDINGDGLSDLLIGANQASPNGNTQAGQTYVVFGSARVWPASLSLSSLNGANGFILNGTKTNESSGSSVSTAGDINGDGLTDLLIGAAHASPNGNTQAGQTYVVFGRAQSWPASLSLSTLNGTNGFILNGIHGGIPVGDESGGSVSTAGDINGDGLADLLIGASGASPNGNTQAGQTYVVFGNTQPWPASLNLSRLNGTNGFVLNGINRYDSSGVSVATAGDINGDGLADLVIGAPEANNMAGQSYVVFGAQYFQLVMNQLNMINGDHVTLNLTNLLIEPIINNTLFLVSQVQQGQFEFANDPGIRKNNFMQMQLSDQEITFYQDGGNIAPSYTISCENGLNTILTQTADIHFTATVAHTTAFLSSYSLTMLNGTNGFILKGIHGGIPGGDQSGWSVSTAGDINGDGLADILIGANQASPHGNTGAGQTYVVFGSAQAWPANLSLSALNGTNGFVLNGINRYDSSGVSVATAGDINGDGLADLLIGMYPEDFPSGNIYAEQTYVVFGSARLWPASMNLSALDGTNGFILNRAKANDGSSESVSTAGDVNGDGLADLLIGVNQASTNGNTKAGQTYVVFGSAQAWPTSLNLSTLNGTNGFILNGINPGDYSGVSVSTAGDINGDGLADILIGASGASPNGNYQAGQTYVVFGNTQPWPASLNLSTLNGTNGFILNGINLNDRSGGSVSTAGDINGDGLADILIGAPGASPNGNYQAGQTYVVFGSAQAWPTSLNLSTLNGTNGFILNGINPGDYSGVSVSTAGDINGDGLADILIGASGASPNGNYQAGQTYVVFGNTQPWPASLNLSTLNGTNGFILNGINPGDYSGVSVSTAGDINSDGLTDILIGAKYVGQTYVVFGRSSVWSTVMNLSNLNGSTGFVLNGIQASDFSGSSVSTAGDVNGDGIPEILIGAYGADINAGNTYLIFGNNPYLQLASNQLTISNGQSIVLTPQILSIRSFAYPRNLVQFSISNVKHGQFQISQTFNGYACSAVCTSNDVTSFTQAQIDSGEIVFVHDGSQYQPSYSVSYYPSKQFSSFSKSQNVTINFVTYLSIDKTTFTVNQYANQFNLTGSNILAHYNLSSDPTEITFTVNEADNGWFANVNKTKTSLNTFKQLDINQGKICFYSPCGVENSNVLPGFILIATAPNGLITAQTSGTVLYNSAPVIMQNAIIIGEKQTVLISTTNIAATDINTSSVNNTAWFDPNIVFSVSAAGGYFQFVNGQSNITTFTQANISHHQVEFISDAMTAPSYNITATDSQGATSLPQAGQVTFQQPSASSTSAAITSTIAASVAIGGVAAAGLGLFLLNRRNNNRLHAYIEQASDKNNSLNKIAEVIFEKIKLTGFLNHIQKNRVTEYVNAIKEILEALTAMGFPVDLATMTEKSRNHFLEEFPRQIKAAFPVSQQSRIQFFKAEITPRQIKSQANYIAQTIKHAMDMIESQILDDDQDYSSDIPLTDVSSHSGCRPDGLQERLIQNREERQETRAPKCCVM